VSFNLNTLVKDPLLSSDLYRPDWVQNTPRAPALLWLDKNENMDADLLKVTNGILKNLDPLAIATYPDSGPVYRKLSELLQLDPKMLRLTPGSDGGIRIVFDAIVSPGDKVIHTSPTFAMYPVYCKMFGAKPIEVKYVRDANGPRLNFSELLTTIKNERAKLVCLPNPDSPTGTILGLDELRTLAKTCFSANSILLVDEAYYPISDVTAQPLLNEFPNLVIARTFAKAWGLAGLRVGYLMASSQLTEIFHKLRPMYEVNTVAVFVLDRMLDKYDVVLASVRRLLAGRDYFLDEMRLLGFETTNSHGNFVHVNFSVHAEKVHSALSCRVLYRKAFAEPCLTGYSRFSLTTREGFEPIVSLIRGAVR
jgi:histidinol-phosphate aminotransferase